MMTIEKLNEFGADTKEGLMRCCGNEGLYLRLVKMIPAEKNFDALKEAIEANDLKAGFEAAHALKGVLGNLSLTPMYERAVTVTEQLRKGADADYAQEVAELLALRDRLGELCAE